MNYYLKIFFFTTCYRFLITKYTTTMTRRCEICKIDIQDEYSFKSHIAGKKHQRKQQFQQKIKEQQLVFDKSIFVSNLPAYASERELFHFFSQFGGIKKFHLQPRHLIIDFQNKYDLFYSLKNTNFFY